MQSKHIRIAVVLLTATAGAVPLAAQSADVPRHLISFAQDQLTEFASHGQIVSQIREHNARGLTLETIRATDSAWTEVSGVSRYMLDLMSNDLSLLLHNFEFEHPYIVETFAMGALGANVGQTNRTSDYWQGDETKFTASYNDGAGSIHYGEIEYDYSADELVIQVSVPVMVGNRAIGAITFSVSLDRWERR